MPTYEVVIRPRAKKALAAIPREFQIRIARSLRELAEDPRPAGCRTLTFGQNIYRIRIGDYRVISQISDADRIVDVAKIARRDEPPIPTSIVSSKGKARGTRGPRALRAPCLRGTSCLVLSITLKRAFFATFVLRVFAALRDFVIQTPPPSQLSSAVAPARPA